ncbi:MAG: hypothetical protein JNJ57_00425 [Saprospiraceae bacterium]|nr:hypothetical protein [Saprospiraceae bacterium]
MKRLTFKLLAGATLTFVLIFLNACQKETFDSQNLKEVQNPVAADRSAGHITYGVTRFDGVNACEIVGIEEGSGNVVSQTNATVIDPSGNLVVLDNLKGICLTSWGQYFITTGSPASSNLGVSAYDNALFKVDPVGGQCSYFGSVCPFGTVSDLEFNPLTNTFFGLLNNSNNILEIQPDVNGNYTVYTPPAAIIGINGRILSGLSLVRDQSNTYLVGAATRPGVTILDAQLYQIPAGGGLAAFMTNLAPLGDFAGGHCGIGFDLDLNHLAVNRANPAISTLAPGLNEVNPWVAPPLPGVTNTNNWGPASFDFEDLTSSVY